jgi:hypothetical protein
MRGGQRVFHLEALESRLLLSADAAAVPIPHSDAAPAGPSTVEEVPLGTGEIASDPTGHSTAADPNRVPSGLYQDVATSDLAPAATDAGEGTLWDISWRV